MNVKHRDIIAQQQVDNLVKLLDATVTKQIVVDSYGHSEKRIIITYEQQN